MPESLRIEVMEASVTAMEKFMDNYESAAAMLKKNLDMKYGSPFQVVIGEAFGFSVTHQENSLMYMFNGGKVAILIWRTVEGPQIVKRSSKT